MLQTSGAVLPGKIPTPSSQVALFPLCICDTIFFFHQLKGEVSAFNPNKYYQDTLINKLS